MTNKAIAKVKPLKLLTLALGLSLGASVSTAAPQPAFVEESLEAYNERMQWFVDSQYGMFIHFGLYSHLGGEYKGQKPKKNQKYSEWIQAHLAIPREDYAEIAKEFNPAQFDADLIASTAKAAGMTYLVITSKHHDGFCLWDSEYTDFDIASTPLGDRDLLGELNEACKKHGIKFGLYYSILDWHHPTQVTDPKAKNPNHVWSRTLLRDGGNGDDKQTYLTFQKNQLLELIEKYDPSILWFDGEWVNWWTVADGIDLYNALRNGSSHVIMNNRVGKRKAFEADFLTKEQRHFDAAKAENHWEACYTMNKSWGYKKGDDDWKDAATVYEKLKDVNSKGGNLLLNVGPDGKGMIQDEAVSILLEAGKLLKANPIVKMKPTPRKVPRLVKGYKAKVKQVINATPGI
jgi:alpha-L-fucosidase